MTVLAVTGLKREAEIAGGPGVIAVAAGGDGGALEEKLGALHGDIEGVISFGLGGALSPLLKLGEAVIADRVIEGGQIWSCSSSWRVSLAARLPKAHQGPVVASPGVVESPATKIRFHDRTGALAVDMESGVAARFAMARGLPLAVLRVISDDAHHVLPPAVLVAMRPDGGIAIGRVLGSLLRHPLQLPRLIGVARGSTGAFRELFRCRARLGAGLARPDF